MLWSFGYIGSRSEPVSDVTESVPKKIISVPLNKKNIAWNSLLNNQSCVEAEIVPSIHQDHHNAHSKQWPLPTDLIETYRKDWKKFVKNIPDRILSRKRGIIYTSFSGVLRPTLIAIKMLRETGCTLDVQVWYYGSEFFPDEIRKLESIPGVKTRNLEEVKQTTFQYKKTRNKMFEVKGAAILFSEFDQVLYLDSDNLPVRDPTFLFDSPAYKHTGAIFWKDFWKTHPSNPIWKIFGVPCRNEFEQESGQLLVDKRRPDTWRALNLAVWMQSERDIYFELVMGDKDTFRFAWKALHVPFHMVIPHVGAIGTHRPQFCGHTMVQFAPLELTTDYMEKEYRTNPLPYQPDPLFLHINLLKYTIYGRGATFSRLQYYNYPFVPNAVGEIFSLGGGLCTTLKPVSDKGIRYEVQDIDFHSILPDFEERYWKIYDIV
jgi:hypothetical protein